jgi:general secretion pathway protein G
MRVKVKCKGFTLIELLIVIVILGLLMSLVAPAMFSKLGSSKQKTAVAQMKMLQTALDTYRLDIGHYPSTLQELRVSKEANWDGPYIPKDIPADPWGNQYTYLVPGANGGEYSLGSYGKDGKAGGTGENEDLSAE